MWISTDRHDEALKELTGMAGFTPHHTPGFMHYDWSFSSRERADLFAINARYVPGVVREPQFLN